MKRTIVRILKTSGDFYLFLFYVPKCLDVCLCIMCVQMKVPDPMGLERLRVVNHYVVLGAKPGSSGRTGSAGKLSAEPSLQPSMRVFTRVNRRDTTKPIICYIIAEQAQTDENKGEELH